MPPPTRRPGLAAFAASLLLLGACARSRGPAPSASPSDVADPPAADSVLSYSMRTFERTDGDCAAPEGCVTVHVQAPEILKAPTVEARKALNRFIRDEWLTASFGQSGSADLATLAEGLFAQRRQFLAESPGQTAKWWVRRGIEVLYQDEHAVSLRYGDDSYTGGETPIDEVLLASFDPTTARRLTLADVLAPGSEETVRALAAGRYRQVRFTPPGGSLPLEGHFAVIEAGLLFRFNAFEIPGEAGVEPAQIVLTRGELQGLLKANGPLAVMPRSRVNLPSPETEAGIETVDPGWKSDDVPR